MPSSVEEHFGPTGGGSVKAPVLVHADGTLFDANPVVANISEGAGISTSATIGSALGQVIALPGTNRLVGRLTIARRAIAGLHRPIRGGIRIGRIDIPDNALAFGWIVHGYTVPMLTVYGGGACSYEVDFAGAFEHTHGNPIRPIDCRSHHELLAGGRTAGFVEPQEFAGIEFDAGRNHEGSVATIGIPMHFPGRQVHGRRGTIEQLEVFVRCIAEFGDDDGTYGSANSSATRFMGAAAVAASSAMRRILTDIHATARAGCETIDTTVSWRGGRIHHPIGSAVRIELIELSFGGLVESVVRRRHIGAKPTRARRRSRRRIPKTHEIQWNRGIIIQRHRHIRAKRRRWPHEK